MKLRIVIPLYSYSVNEKSFVYGGDNPGVGGTQFVSIMLAIGLAKQYPDLDVLLLNEKPVNIFQSFPNLRQVEYAFNDVLDSDFLKSSETILLSPVAILDRWSTACSNFKCKVIAWHHHPFDLNLASQAIRCDAHVSVGSYQYFSNNSFFDSHWHIQNIFFEANELMSGYSEFDIASHAAMRFVFLGALIPAKGFHYVVQSWPEIRRVFPNSTLDVIGSTSTYSGHEPEDSQIPTTKDYASEIIKYLPQEDIDNGRVVFHGNLGVEKKAIIQRAHVAILNPTGSSEAFPASPLECMSHGVPVIASDDFGMSDVMRFFPQLSLRRPADIPSRITWLFSDYNRYQEMRSRSIDVARWYAGQSQSSLLRWRQLFELISLKQSIYSNPPVLPFHGNKINLLTRRWKRRLSSFKNSYYSRKV